MRKQRAMILALALGAIGWSFVNGSELQAMPSIAHDPALKASSEAMTIERVQCGPYGCRGYGAYRGHSYYHRRGWGYGRGWNRSYYNRGYYHPHRYNRWR